MPAWQPNPHGHDSPDCSLTVTSVLIIEKSADADLTKAVDATGNEIEEKAEGDSQSEFIPIALEGHSFGNSGFLDGLKNTPVWHTLSQVASYNDIRLVRIIVPKYMEVQMQMLQLFETTVFSDFSEHAIHAIAVPKRSFAGTDQRVD